MVAQGVEQYSKRWRIALTAHEREAAVVSYAVGQEAVDAYRARVMKGLAEAPLEFVNGRMVMNLCLALYRVLSRADGPATVTALAACLAEFTQKGVSIAVGVRVLPLCLRAAGRGNVEDTVRKVRRETREVMEQMKKRPARKRAFDIGISAQELLSDDSPLERIQRANAIENLKRALANQRAVVREVAAYRLLTGLSYEELAARTGLTADDVSVILTELRPHVAKATPYFNADWWWQENAPLVTPSEG